MKDQIIKLLQDNKHRRYDIKAIATELGATSSDDYKAVAKAVLSLEDDAKIIPNAKNKYTLIENTAYKSGVLDVKDKGFAFLAIDDSDEDDIYIPKHKLHDAMHRDRVLLYVETSKSGLKKEGEVKRILKRNYTTLIGTVIKRGKSHLLISDDKSIRQDVIIKEDGLNHAKPHDKVQARITKYAYKNSIEVEIVQVLGPMDAPGVDIFSKILKHNIDPGFPEMVLKEAEQFKTIHENDKANRTDLRNRTIVTIDGEDAKDFDDAIDISIKGEDFVLGVHIADVSHYVKESSLLDKEAYRRGTSIYLVDRVIPMLPENLSNNLCSLMPDVERLAMSCELTLSKKGKLKDMKIYPSIIRSKARMTYTAVNKILAGDTEYIQKYQAIAPMFTLMKDLAKVLYDKRTLEGSIHFETEEPEITLDGEGRAIHVAVKTRGASEAIIEEFMLMANQAIARHIYWMQLPFIYRIHDEPKEEKLEKLLSMATALGFDVKGKTEISHKELQKLLQKVDNTASEKGINLVMLRSMQKAVYSDHNIGHFGLGFEHYTHFTSPIRRYPDLLVHRLLRKYLIDKNFTNKDIETLYTTVADTAKQASAKERSAIDLEREVLDMKKAEYMSRFIGKTFTGTISSVTSFGIYVSLPNTVEGLVHITELYDDYYVFNEDLLTLVGKNTKNVYRIGDTVKVKVAATNITDGEIDFELKRM